MQHTQGVGRFAPSPTGDLHFGSLLAAVASYSEARSKNNLWIVRIDDIDGPRSVKGSEQSIITTLSRFGFRWDNDIQHQSLHNSRYREALAKLIDQNLVFSCGCSRRSLPQGQIYPGTCRSNRVLSINDPVGDRAVRLILPENSFFDDQVQGQQRVALQTDVGDVIIWRRDKLVSYSLACAIDDALDCTEVVRGADLLPFTAAQISIMKYLMLQPPLYAHIPIAIDVNGDKLSKHSQAEPIMGMDVVKTLLKAWLFLGQSAIQASTVEQFWAQALPCWQLNKVPKLQRMAHWADE